MRLSKKYTVLINFPYGIKPTPALPNQGGSSSQLFSRKDQINHFLSCLIFALYSIYIAYIELYPLKPQFYINANRTNVLNFTTKKVIMSMQPFVSLIRERTAYQVNMPLGSTTRYSLQKVLLICIFKICTIKPFSQFSIKIGSYNSFLFISPNIESSRMSLFIIFLSFVKNIRNSV